MPLQHITSMRQCDLHIQNCVLSGVKRQLGHLCRTGLYSNVKFTLQKEWAISARTAEKTVAIIPGASNEPEWMRQCDPEFSAEMNHHKRKRHNWNHGRLSSFKSNILHIHVNLLSWGSTRPERVAHNTDALTVATDAFYWPNSSTCNSMSSSWQGNTA